MYRRNTSYSSSDDSDLDFETHEVLDAEETKRRSLLQKVPLPYLTIEERKLPRGLRKLVIVSKKCSDSGKFGLVSAMYMSTLFQESEDFIPRFEPSQNEKFYPAQYTHGHSCVNFHLRWMKQETRSLFMKNWLTASVRSDLFQRIPFDSVHEIKGKIVVAQWIVDNCWYRGLILKVQDHYMARVYYIDQGNVEVQSVETLRIIPEELTKIPPMAFRATLADTNLSSEQEACKYGRTQLEFVLKLKTMLHFWCRIRRIIMSVDGLQHSEEGSSSGGIRFGLDQAVVILSDPTPDFESIPGTKKWKTFNEVVRNSMGHELFVGPVTFQLDSPLPDEKKLLIKCHPSDAVVIKPKTLSFKEPSFYRIIHSVHPQLFYIKEVTEAELALTKERDARMQDFYNNFGPSFENYIIRTNRVFQGRHYVWRRPQSHHWYRVRVVRVDVPLGQCFVYLTDVGKEFLVNVEDMMELKAEFSLLSARATKAHLAHVKPIVRENAACTWPETTRTEFQKLAKELPSLYGIALQKEWMPGITGASSSTDSSDSQESVAIILVDQNFRNGYTLQARLRLMGLVGSDGFASGTNHLAFLCYDGIPSYNRQKMFASVRIELNENVPMLKDSSNLGQPELKQGSLISSVDYFKGDPSIQPYYEGRGTPSKMPPLYPCNCHTPCADLYHFRNTIYSEKFGPSLQPKNRYIHRVGNFPYLQKNDGPFTHLFGDYIGAVRISHVVGPGVFYIQMQNKINELYLLMEGIGEVIGNYSVCSLDAIKDDEFYVGSLVAVHVENDLRKEVLWHRAYLCRLLTDKKIAKVTLLDFGVLMNVRFENIRSLPDYFWGIPSYCHRAHLDVLSCEVLRNYRWTTRMNEIFKEFVELNPHTTFLATKTRSSPNDQVEVEDYGQDLFFEAKKSQWYAGGDLIDYPIVPRDDDSRKFVYHLLHSYGLSLWFEDISDGKSFDRSGNVGYKFTSVEHLFL